jgi:hypothetical protein
MSGDADLRRYQAALADAESKRKNAWQASQVWQGLLEQRHEGAPVEDSELDQARDHARRTAQEAQEAEEAALAYRRRAIATPTATDAPRLPAGMRIVSGPALRAWREKCLENPRLAQARGWDPNRPPAMHEDHISALAGPSDPKVA